MGEIPHCQTKSRHQRRRERCAPCTRRTKSPPPGSGWDVMGILWSFPDSHFAMDKWTMWMMWMFKMLLKYVQYSWIKLHHKKTQSNCVRWVRFTREPGLERGRWPPPALFRSTSLVDMARRKDHKTMAQIATKEQVTKAQVRFLLFGKIRRIQHFSMGLHWSLHAAMFTRTLQMLSTSEHKQNQGGTRLSKLIFFKTDWSWLIHENHDVHMSGFDWTPRFCLVDFIGELAPEHMANSRVSWMWGSAGQPDLDQVKG